MPFPEACSRPNARSRLIVGAAFPVGYHAPRCCPPAHPISRGPRPCERRSPRPDAFGVVLVLILATIIVFAAAVGPVGQLLSVALSGGTLLFVLHTAGAGEGRSAPRPSSWASP